MKLIDPEKGEGRLIDHIAGAKRVLIVFWHGVGDAVMFGAPLYQLQQQYPDVEFTVGLCRGLQEEAFFPKNHILLDGSWREDVQKMDYDLVFVCHFPAEDLKDTTKTKAEICCERELGIAPTWGHTFIHAPVRPLVGVHFQNTSVSWLANPDEETARKIWRDIEAAGAIPIELHFQHAFHNPENKCFDFVKQNVRNWQADIHSLVSLMARIDFFIGVVSGPFHLALSMLGPERVMLLEKELKVGHFTKYDLAHVDLKNYQSGAIQEWIGGFAK